MTWSPPDLTGKVAVVTGASRGVGKCVALRLAECGADVVVAARSVASRERLPGTIHDTVREIESLGRRALAIRTDVRDADAVAEMIDRAAGEMGRLDILVNNAGALWWDTVERTPIKRFDLVVGVNVRASFAATRAAIPHMERAGGGHIFVYSPPIDLGMLPGKVAYCVSKFGMTMLAMGLADEVREQGIACAALWPTTVIESQASINHGLGTRAQWRKPLILADATLAIVGRPIDDVTGRAFLDEEALSEVGVTDFSKYACVPGGELLRIVGAAAQSSLWRHRTRVDQERGTP
jgi:citronellol/citronellal dehydrogenase